MAEHTETGSSGWIVRLRGLPVVGIFFDKSFLHYAWSGVTISILNIVLLWLLIDIVLMPTVLASTFVIGATFLLRYVLFRFLNVL